MASSHLQLGQPKIIVLGRELKYIGKELINITPADGDRADIVATLNGSISKISPIDEVFSMVLPVQVGSGDDAFLQDSINSRTNNISLTGSVSQIIVSSDGNLGSENYDIHNGVIQRSPDRSVSYGIENINGEAFALYPVKFVGKRVV